ncbi:alpha/beta hydrolase family protein [Nocardia huaxiensis]|nr:alpha/beta fold hydrolase [Nocardia huaxiensis]UFT00393.1 S9 family peptidase [Nocardia huaxiensis]
MVLAAGVWILHQNDYALREERVTISGAAQPLQGVLARPRDGAGPFGLVVFVHGDGPIDATHDTFYRPIWEALARAGYASLSWDKPGVAGAEGNWLHQSMADRAAEASAAIDWARERTDIDPRRIGLWGASQAGWVLPEIAATRTDLRFLILVSPAINWSRQGEYHLRAELRARDATATDTAAALRRRDTVLRLLDEHADYARYLAESGDPEPMSADRWTFVSKNYTADASDALRRTRIPVFLALGDHDVNVDAAETERTYRDLLTTPGRLTVARYRDATHGMTRIGLDGNSLSAVLTALFAPRSLFTPGFLTDQGDYVRLFAAPANS